MPEINEALSLKVWRLYAKSFAINCTPMITGIIILYIMYFSDTNVSLVRCNMIVYTYSEAKQKLARLL